MSVYDTQSGKLVSNVTSRSPIFTVGGLESGLGFDILLYAANEKGSSDVARLQASTLKSAEKHTGKVVMRFINWIWTVRGGDNVALEFCVARKSLADVFE